MPDSDFERVIKESDIALQVCTAGNLRTTLLCARLAEEHGAFDRFIMGTDTPTGSGVMPLGLLYTIAHCASLTHMAPERFVCAATGSNARVYRLDSGFRATGKAADIVLLDAPNPGSGRVFDWCEVSGALDGVRLLLAGGLTPDNVAEAIRRVRPWGVDVSTGVETAPGSGRKDPRKLRRFIQAARAASAALEHRGSPNGGIGHQPYDWQAEGA